MPKSTNRVSVINLGCRVNRSESDFMEEQLIDAGYQLVTPKNAQLVIINTCAVTSNAEKTTRKVIRQHLRQEGEPFVVVTGCAANLRREEYQSWSNRLIVLSRKDCIVQIVDELELDDVSYVSLKKEEDIRTHQLTVRRDVKIQDGCDNRCTYCIVWKARGKARSKDPDTIIRYISGLVAQDVPEIVLTGIDIGAYSDLENGTTVSLAQLMDRILNETNVKRLRISSIEPKSISNELLDVMNKHPKRVARHLHIPLQSGSESVLSAMGRNYTAKEFLELSNQIYKKLPDIALTTDVIVGFPGESDADFKDTLQVIQEAGITKVHTFRFSPREGTLAAMFDNQIQNSVVSERAEQLRLLAHSQRIEDAKRRIGTSEQVIIEHVDDDYAIGTSSSYHPVKIEMNPEFARSLTPNTLVEVNFIHVKEDGSLMGRVIDG